MIQSMRFAAAFSRVVVNIWRLTRRTAKRGGYGKSVVENTYVHQWTPGLNRSIDDKIDVGINTGKLALYNSYTYSDTRDIRDVRDIRVKRV